MNKKGFVPLFLLIVAGIFAMGMITEKAFGDTTGTFQIPVIGSLNLSNLLSSAGAIDTYDNHGVNRAGVSIRGLWYPNDAANPSNPADNAWVGAEGIATWDTSTGAPAGLGAWVGLRADTLGGKLFGKMPSVGHLPIPSVEIGPMVQFIENAPPNQHFVYGGAFAAHF